MTGSRELAEYQARLSSAGITSDYRAVLVRGVPQNPMFDVQAFEDVVDGFRTKDGDVFVATYVKAGTTWVQQILHGLLRGGESGGRYGETVPWLEACASSPEVIGPREAPGWTMEKINAAPAPRYFKTHARVEDLPRGRARLRVVYVARNPKDTVVSLYHHARNKPEFGFTGDFETFLQIFLSDLAEFTSPSLWGPTLTFVDENGGERGIRTPGELPHTRIPAVHLQPLGHLSAQKMF